VSAAIVRHPGVGTSAAPDAASQIAILQAYFNLGTNGNPMPTAAQTGQAANALGALATLVQTLSTELAACQSAAPGTTTAAPVTTPGPGVWVSGTATALMTAGAAGVGGVFGWWLGKRRRAA
jgi:hypothetical protein